MPTQMCLQRNFPGPPTVDEKGCAPVALFGCKFLEAGFAHNLAGRGSSQGAWMDNIQPRGEMSQA